MKALNKLCKLLIVVGMVLSTISEARAATGGDALRAPISPRAIAMGEAAVSSSKSTDGMLYNPAELATIKNIDLKFMHLVGFVDSTEYIAIAKTLKIGGIIGASVVYRYLPTIDNVGANDDPIEVNDTIITLSYARGISVSNDKKLDFLLGINLKWLRTKLGNQDDNVMAADIGAQWIPNALKDFQFGLAIQNIGMPIKYNETSDSLPILIRTGVQYQVFQAKQHDVILALDFNVPIDTDLIQINLGSEYWFNQLVAARIGYQYQANTLASGIRAGLGFNFKLGPSSLLLDYAIKPLQWSEQTIDFEHAIAFGIAF